MLKQFFEAVLPRAGNYAIFTLGTKKHLWADSVDKLARMVETRHDVQGVYYATAAFNEPIKRSQDNVQYLRSLRLDIDAGARKFASNPSGAYETQRDALAALIAFSQSASLAPSYIVSSGEGLHVYYCLSEDASPSSWLPLAKRLGELCVQHGLKADPTVTNDTARVLRPPGSLHPNGSRVTVLKETGKVYHPDKLARILGVEAEAISKKVYDTSVNDDFLGQVEGPPKSTLKILEHCVAMREAAQAKGDVQEPYWRAMLGIVKHTVEGLEMAHELSRGHADYDPSETEKKFNAYSAGPTSCAEFGRHTKACGTCQFNGKIKSPIVLGYMTEAQVAELPPEKRPPEPTVAPPTGDPWDDCMPAGFDVISGPKAGQRTLRYAMKVPEKSATGDWTNQTVMVSVTHDIFWLGTWASAESSKDTAQVTVNTLIDGVVKTYLMDQSLVPGAFDLQKYLASKGIQLTTDKKAGQAVTDYVKMSLQRIKNMARRPRVNGRFGLRIADNGDLICAQGEHVIFPDGRIEEAVLDEHLVDPAKQFVVPLPQSATGEWEPVVWGSILPLARKYVEFMKNHYGQPGLEKYQLVAMLGLASPFMAFVTGSYTTGLDLPKNGLSVSLYSRGSEKGKTALVQAIMLAYGRPDMLVSDSNASGATDNGRLARLSTSGTFPTSMDEMGNTKELSITNMISAVANGGGKTRATKEGGYFTTQSWALINLITTNRSQRDMVKVGQEESSAIQYRLLELNVDDVYFSREDRTDYRAAWADVQQTTAGALGAIINYAACKTGWAKLNKALVGYVEEADKVLQAEQGARFQYRALGAMLFLQDALTKMGLAMFDRQVLIDEFKKAHASGVAYVAENVLPTNGVELMSMCLSDLKDQTLITETETHRGRDPTRFDMSVSGRTPDKVVARHAIKMGWTYVSSAALREWCELKKVPEREMLADCKKAGVLMPYEGDSHYSRQVDLFKGTREAAAVRTRCYKVSTKVLAALCGGVSDELPDNVIEFPTKEVTRDAQHQEGDQETRPAS